MGKKSDESRDKEAQKLKKTKAGKKEKKSGKAKDDKPDKSSNKRKKAAHRAAPVSAEKRLEMIATAAYYIAERHGFTPGREASDWQIAERQIDAMISGDG